MSVMAISWSHPVHPITAHGRSTVYKMTGTATSNLCSRASLKTYLKYCWNLALLWVFLRRSVWFSCQFRNLRLDIVDSILHVKQRGCIILQTFLISSIPLAFQDVVDNSQNSQLARLLEYVSGMWVESTVWPSSTWSVFWQPVRTNNDVEGWHCRLNVKANHGQLNLYQLIQLLHAESQLVDISVRMLSECGTMRLQNNAYSKLHSRLHQLWNEYCAGSREVAQLLNACARATKCM